MLAVAERVNPARASTGSTIGAAIASAPREGAEREHQYQTGRHHAELQCDRAVLAHHAQDSAHDHIRDPGHPQHLAETGTEHHDQPDHGDAVPERVPEQFTDPGRRALIEQNPGEQRENRGQQQVHPRKGEHRVEHHRREPPHRRGVHERAQHRTADQRGERDAVAHQRRGRSACPH